MSPQQSIPSQILAVIQAEQLQIGSHLPAQMLADRLRISRSPINQALAFLEERGVLERKNNRGYFIKGPIKKSLLKQIGKIEFNQNDLVASVYLQIAEDRLKGRLPDAFSETMIKNQYGLTPAQTGAVLSRIAQEGWIEKKAGYGWEFTPMLTTSEALLQSYRLRLTLEPAALLEPGYRISQQTIDQCRAAEMHLLNGGIQTDSAIELHDRGVRFHESLVVASGSTFFIDAIRRVNRLRRLISYRSMKDRSRYQAHCKEHLKILAVLEKGRNREAAAALKTHLAHTLKNLEGIKAILKP